MTQNPCARVQRELNRGERLLWCGTGHGGKSNLIAMLSTTGIVVAGIVILHKTEIKLLPLFLIVVVLLGLSWSIFGSSEDWLNPNSSAYGLTDRWVLVFRNGKFYRISLKQLRDLELNRGKHGRGTITAITDDPLTQKPGKHVVTKRRGVLRKINDAETVFTLLTNAMTEAGYPISIPKSTGVSVSVFARLWNALRAAFNRQRKAN